MFHGFVLALHLFVCFALIAVVLLQAGRGGGVADTFGGNAAQSILGTRGTQFLTRATSVCAALFMLTSLTLAYLSAQKGRSLMEQVKTPIETPEVPAAVETSAPAQEAASAEKPAQQP